MDLSRYEKMMERRMERTAFPISEAELCQRYEKLYTGAVNDVLREEGLIMQTLPNGIMPLREEMTVCGIAFTVAGMNYKDYLSSVRREKAAADKLQYISYLSFYSKINVHNHIQRFCGIWPGF